MPLCICCCKYLPKRKFLLFVVSRTYSHICTTCANKDWGDYILCRFCGGVYTKKDIKSGRKCKKCNAAELKPYFKNGINKTKNKLIREMLNIDL